MNWQRPLLRHFSKNVYQKKTTTTSIKTTSCIAKPHARDYYHIKFLLGSNILPVGFIVYRLIRFRILRFSSYRQSQNRFSRNLLDVVAFKTLQGHNLVGINVFYIWALYDVNFSDFFIPLILKGIFLSLIIIYSQSPLGFGVISSGFNS